MAPNITPIKLPFIIDLRHFRKSFSVAPTPARGFFSSLISFLQKKFKISGIAKRPINTGIKFKPANKFVCPKTNRLVP